MFAFHEIILPGSCFVEIQCFQEFTNVGSLVFVVENFRCHLFHQGNRITIEFADFFQDIFDFFNTSNANFIVLTIGSPPKFKEVFNNIGIPVFFSKQSNN